MKAKGGKTTRLVKKADKKQAQGLKAAGKNKMAKSQRKMTKSTKLRTKAYGGQKSE